MAWQKCPVCSGSGRGFNFALNQDTYCNVCQGAGIIGELTGLPPKGAIPQTITTTDITFDQKIPTTFTQ